MPQMMPLNWIVMFSSLVMIVLILIVFMFYIIQPSPFANKLSIKNTMLSWKW